MKHLVNNSKKIQSQLTLCLSLAILSSDRHHPYTQQLTSCYQSKYHYNLKELWFPLGLCEQEQMGHVIKLLL